MKSDNTGSTKASSHVPCIKPTIIVVLVLMRLICLLGCFFYTFIFTKISFSPKTSILLEIISNNSYDIRI